MNASILHNGFGGKGSFYGDGPFHMNLASGFAIGANNVRHGFDDIWTLFYYGEKLAYPYIPNYLSGVLMATGEAPMRESFVYPSYLMVLSFFFGQYFLFMKFTHDNLATTIALILYMNLGGLGWIKKLLKPAQDYADWVFIWGGGQYEYWFQPLFHVLVCQRASLFSYPFCYWTLLLLITGIEKEDWKLFLIAGILTGFTPMVQVHSFVSLAQWAIIFCIITFPFYKKNIKDYMNRVLLWAVYGISANIIAIPQLSPFFFRVSAHKGNFIQINPLWYGTPKESLGNFWGPLLLWWRGLGIFFAIAIFLGIPILTWQQFKVYIPSLFVFVTTNIIRYQPWSLDNTKLFYAVWIPIALPVVAQYFACLLRNRKTIPIFLVLFWAACYSSYLYNARCFRVTDTLFNSIDREFGYWVAESTPKKAVFLASEWHVHPITSIAGRQIFCGFGGWVASHGLDYSRMRIQKEMFSHPDTNLATIRSNNLSYYAKTGNDRTATPGELDSRYFSQIFHASGFSVYKVLPD